MQHSYSTLWSGYETDAEAKAARDTVYRELKAKGQQVKRWVLKNQLKQYAGFGIPDGRSCDVYMLNVVDEAGRF